MNVFSKITLLILLTIIAVLCFFEGCADTMTLRAQLEETGIFETIKPDSAHWTDYGLTIFWKSQTGRQVRAGIPHYQFPSKFARERLISVKIFFQRDDESLQKYLQGNQKTDLTEAIRDYIKMVNIKLQE